MAAIVSSARVWRSPSLSGFELLRATMPASGFPRKVHEASSIGLLERGGEVYRHRRGSDVASSEDISFVNPLEPHASSAATPAGFQYRAFQPDPALLESLTFEVTGDVHAIAFRQPTVRDPRLAAKLIRLHRDLEQPTSDLEAGVRVRTALVELLTRHGEATLREPTPEPHAVRAVLEYIEAHLNENTSLETLAALAQLSPYHLAKTFAKVVGVPPHVYVTAQRIEQAKRLLRGGLSPAVVALEVGFFDQSHLNRKFRDHVGVSSTAYRRATRTS